uniref:(northern house mosquito) hypothetical protein n=1 Tax=Culex pipiens TaxID=7175 RepID=A0A8D8BQT7_CULPI
MCRKRQERQGPARTERCRAGEWPRNEPSDASEEAAASHRRATPSGAGPVSDHWAAGSHLGRLRVASGHWSSTVRGIVHALAGGRPHVGHPLEEGAGKVSRRDTQVPPG